MIQWLRLRRTLRDQRRQILALEQRLELARQRNEIMDRLLTEDADTIARQQLVIGKQKEALDELLEQLRQRGNGDGDGNES